MRLLTFDGLLKLLDRIDFLDFVSGTFRSRIQAGTLTADRTATLPDLTGNILMSSIDGASGSDAILNVISLTQAEYDAIGTKNATTLYVVTD